MRRAMIRSLDTMLEEVSQLKSDEARLHLDEGSRMICKTCKWWIENEPGGALEWWILKQLRTPLDPDTFERMENLPFDVKRCSSPRLTFYERPVESTGACLVDGSEYMAELITAEEFGCVNWRGADAPL